jgi:hypothetical protein
MTSVFSSIFSNEEIQYLLQLPEVVAAKDRFGSSDKVQFTIALTDGIRTALQTRFGLDLSSVSEIPMRWIKGDTEAHVDRGSRSFENTYLVYLQDSEGEFVLGTDSYPITANTGFIFSEGTMHKTLNTGLTPRLLIGPMNEFAGPVGVVSYATIIYYANLTDATNGTNALASGVQGATLQTVSGYSSWRVARVLDGATPQSVPSGVFASGYTITNWAGYAQRFTYYLYASQAVCFLEGTQILCLKDDVETYMPIETMRAGTLVKTRLDGYKKVELIGKNVIVNPGHSDRIEARLYKLSPSQYSELHEDLFITGAHAVLVETITDKQREELTKQAGKIFITDKKYRLMAMFDERAEPWASEGTYTIWHFALEHTNIVMNYGVYANGLLVETCSINTMQTKANLLIV